MRLFATEQKNGPIQGSWQRSLLDSIHLFAQLSLKSFLLETATRHQCSILHEYYGFRAPIDSLSQFRSIMTAEYKYILQFPVRFYQTMAAKLGSLKLYIAHVIG